MYTNIVNNNPNSIIIIAYSNIISITYNNVYNYVYYKIDICIRITVD